MNRKMQKMCTIGLTLILLSAIAIPLTTAASPPTLYEIERTIPDEKIPLGMIWFPHIRAYSWALTNLVLCVIGVLSTFVAALHKLVQMNQSAKEKIDFGKDLETNGITKNHCVRYLAVMLITSFASVLLFILTQDMTKPMVITDRWTIVHIIILVVGTAVTMLFIRSNKSKSKLI